MSTTQWASSLQQRIVQQLIGPLDDALQLARRYRELEALQDYVGARLRLVLPAGLLLAVTAIACAMTPVMLLLGTRPVAALAGLLLAPVVFIGSLFVLCYVFFSWLEERALARSLGHRTGPAPGKLARWLKRKMRADLGKAPPVPWLLATLLVLAPLAALARIAPAIAVLLIGLLVLTPILYARFDR
jgi:hypothetical protein